MRLIRIRVYRTPKEVLVAACDSGLLGRKLRDGELRLDVSSFYDGFEADRAELVSYLRLATIANLVGEEVVRIAVEEGFIDESCVLRVDGIPHAQMVLI